MSRVTLSQMQMEMLVEELEKRPYLVSGKLDESITKNTLQDSWIQVTAMINSISCGPPIELKALKKRWSQWRSRVKTKAALLHKERSKFGGSKQNTPPLTDIEERVMHLIRSEEFGLQSTNLYEIGTCSQITTADVDPTAKLQIISEVSSSSEAASSVSQHEVILPCSSQDVDITDLQNETHLEYINRPISESSLRTRKRRKYCRISEEEDILKPSIAESVSSQTALTASLQAIEQQLERNNALLERQNQLAKEKNVILLNILQTLQQNNNK